MLITFLHAHLQYVRSFEHLQFSLVTEAMVGLHDHITYCSLTILIEGFSKLCTSPEHISVKLTTACRNNVTSKSLSLKL